MALAWLGSYAATGISLIPVIIAMCVKLHHTLDHLGSTMTVAPPPPTSRWAPENLRALRCQSNGTVNLGLNRIEATQMSLLWHIFYVLCFLEGLRSFLRWLWSVLLKIGDALEKRRLNQEGEDVYSIHRLDGGYTIQHRNTFDGIVYLPFRKREQLGTCSSYESATMSIAKDVQDRKKK
jgi:hypothetical protein